MIVCHRRQTESTSWKKESLFWNWTLNAFAICKIAFSDKRTSVNIGLGFICFCVGHLYCHQCIILVLVVVCKCFSVGFYAVYLTLWHVIVSSTYICINTVCPMCTIIVLQCTYNFKIFMNFPKWLYGNAIDTKIFLWQQKNFNGLFLLQNGGKNGKFNFISFDLHCFVFISFRLLLSLCVFCCFQSISISKNWCSVCINFDKILTIELDLCFILYAFEHVCMFESFDLSSRFCSFNRSNKLFD